MDVRVRGFFRERRWFEIIIISFIKYIIKLNMYVYCLEIVIIIVFKEKFGFFLVN